MSVFEPAPTEANPDHKKRTGEKLVLDAEGRYQALSPGTTVLRHRVLFPLLDCLAITGGPDRDNFTVFAIERRGHRTTDFCARHQNPGRLILSGHRFLLRYSSGPARR
jgi:hypothetical protein